MPNNDGSSLQDVIAHFRLCHKLGSWWSCRDRQTSLTPVAGWRCGFQLGRVVDVLKGEHVGPKWPRNLLRLGVVVGRQQATIQHISDLCDPCEVEVMPGPSAHARPIVDRHTGPLSTTLIAIDSTTNIHDQ